MSAQKTPKHYLTSLSDEELIVYIRTQDSNAFAEVIRRYQEKLLRYAHYLVADEAAAADVVQESFITVFIHLQSFNESKKFSSWIYRIVHNKSLNVIKKNKKFVTLDFALNQDDDVDLEDAVIQKELIENAHVCLEKMPIEYRVPLTLFFLEEKSYNEISDILRIPVNTVGTRIRRAKLLLRKVCQTKK